MTPLLKLLFLSGIHATLAAPLQKRAASDDGNNGGFQPAIYIPVIVVAVAVVLITVSTALRKRANRRASSSTTTGPGIVQVTANQLTGRNASNNTNNNATSGQTRRARRNRRRASQMSVTSLPLYMEEAGETELVLVRGDREMHDPIEDHDEESHNNEGAEEGVPVSNEGSSHRRSHSTSRRSYDSAESTQEDNELVTSPLMEDHLRSVAHGITSQIQESDGRSIPQEEAPPYSEQSEAMVSEFREVDLGSDPVNPQEHNVTGVTQPQSNAEPVERPATGNSTTRRLPLRAMPNLRNLFTRTPSGSNNNENGGRTLASSSSRAHLLSHQRSNSSFSNSSSMLHLTPTTSRLSSRHLDRSMNASQISLASISSPLQHTLVKTEFSYPKSGPTQDQMKFLGSRESLALFGVPFGSAAVAYSRVEPPPFAASSSEPHAEPSITGDSEEPSQEPPGHAQEPTDVTVTAESAGQSQTPNEPNAEGSGDAQGAEVPIRADLREPASPISAAPVTTSSVGFVTAPSVSRPASAAGEEGPATPKMNIPITIIREPSPAPPTPPPTPPRQSLNVAEEAMKAPAETVISAAASA